MVYETDNLFTFHHANAYEEDGQIIVDIAAYNSGEVMDYICDRFEYKCFAINLHDIC